MLVGWLRGAGREICQRDGEPETGRECVATAKGERTPGEGNRAEGVNRWVSCGRPLELNLRGAFPILNPMSALPLRTATPRVLTYRGAVRRPPHVRLLTCLAAALALTAGGLALSGPAGAVDDPLLLESPALAPFVGQQVRWEPCGSAECATIRAPMDYANPAAGELTLAATRMRNTGPDRLGTIFVNPGGPGSAAQGFATWLARVSPVIADAYDVVAFDPRGVGESTPIQCITGPQTTRWLLTDPTPDTTSEIRTVMARAATIGRGCRTRAPDLARHIGTDASVRDLDLMRAIVGDPTLNLLGFSYATVLGTRYAELFPARVGRLVLDGALDQRLDGMQLSRGQSTGFQRAIIRFARDCVRHSNCVARTPDGVIRYVNRLLDRVDAQPLRGGSLGPVDEAQVLAAVFYSLYSADSWPTLRTGLAQARSGSGAALQVLASQSWSRSGPTTYSTNANSAFYAISCWDLPPAPGPVGFAAAARRWSLDAAVPAMARASSWGNAPCTGWFGHDPGGPHTANSATTAPILIIGTRYDPATPYEWAVSLNRQLPTSRLLTYDGDGHTAFGGQSSCVDGAVAAFLVSGTLPEPGARCR